MIVMKQKLNLKVSYYTRDGKEHKGESPIMLRVSLDGNRSSFGQIGLSVEPKHLSKSRVLNDNPNAIYLNAELNELEARIRFFAEQLQGKGRLSLESLKEELSGKRKDQHYISVYCCPALLSDKSSKLVIDGSIPEYLRCLVSIFQKQAPLLFLCFLRLFELEF